jgi:hypothetical protein
MITILLLVGSIFVLAIGVLGFQVSHAPVGHEDAEGFHCSDEVAPRRTSRKAAKAKSARRSSHGTARHLAAT